MIVQRFAASTLAQPVVVRLIVIYSIRFSSSQSDLLLTKAAFALYHPLSAWKNIIAVGSDQDEPVASSASPCLLMGRE